MKNNKNESNFKKLYNFWYIAVFFFIHYINLLGTPIINLSKVLLKTLRYLKKFTAYEK